MKLKPSLLLWHLRAGWKFAWPTAVVLLVYVLFEPKLLRDDILFPTALAGYVIALAAVASWKDFRAPAAGFLYTRGFTRDEIWLHRIIARILLIAIVWVPSCLVVMLPIRSLIQDARGNPNYPLAAALDWPIPWLSLAAILPLAMAAEYAAIRKAQPTLDHLAGRAILFGMVAYMLAAGARESSNAWQETVYLVVTVVASLALLVASRKLHRELEVQP